VVVWIYVVLLQEIIAIEKFVEKVERWNFKRVGWLYGSWMAGLKGGKIIGWYDSWKGW